jgi:primosomal protein N' (replication factor Y)
LTDPTSLPRIADVSLPVPLDRTFSYLLPETLRHRVQVGSRVTVPFGARKLTGVILKLHDTDTQLRLKPVERLVDEQPVFNAHLIELARWIAAYYCAPTGEVLRTMAPLGGEVGRRRTYTLTDAGRDVARQLTLGSPSAEDATVEILRLLDQRPLSEATLAQKVPKAANALKSLVKKGFLILEDEAAARDPLRSPADRLEAEFLSRGDGGKLPKKERELLAFLELHPGTHRLDQLETMLAGGATAARALARKNLIRVELIAPALSSQSARVDHPLNPHQQAALDTIAQALAGKTFQPFLLQGVTGSGKTEVYLRSMDLVLAQGRSALLLVPEIALTPQVAAQFFARFGSRAAILHSAFNDTERAAQWRKIHSGEVTVAVGTRSAVFAPLRDLGLIIVDEEHDNSYKQEENPRYHGRDVAIVRGRMMGATVVLGSATPSLESRYNVERGKYALLELPERIENRPMPEVELIDMRQEFLETRKQQTFSRRMLDAIRERLANREQVMLLLNRRGFSSFVTCRACGERIMCANCSITLTYHRRDHRLLCHFCNYAEKVPDKCPKCDSEYLQFLGTGSEKVEEELHREFPTARIARMDRDTITGKHQYESILNNFRAGEFDILVGTQMIAKGHDIPNVTFAGIINADIGLGMPDFRAAERTFQLLTQAAGRAGRGQIAGQVLIQTINPDHYAVRFAAVQDYRLFYEKEIQFRRAMRYPPFAALANLVVRSEEQEAAQRMSGDLAQQLTPPPEGIKILGPSEAAVPKLKREFRYQLLLKSASRPALAATLHRLRQYAIEQKWPATALVIDVDPMSLM